MALFMTLAFDDADAVGTSRTRHYHNPELLRPPTLLADSVWSVCQYVYNVPRSCIDLTDTKNSTRSDVIGSIRFNFRKITSPMSPRYWHAPINCPDSSQYMHQNRTKQ
jgi:hypothetical protein